MTYNAFISYSHALDMQFGAAIQTGLQRLGKPWYKLRQLNIFRDETDLSASPALWQRIEEALNQAEYFILLASPQSAQSRWVMKEVAFWVQNKDVNKLIIVLTAGAIDWGEGNDFDWIKTVSLPQSLSTRYQEIPNYIDFTLFRTSTDLSLDNPAFKTSIAKISAVIQGIPAKELIDKAVQEHRKTIRLRNAVIATMLVFLIGLSVTLFIIVQQRNAAQRVATANQHVVNALNKISVTQSLYHAYKAYELHPSHYIANLLSGFGEEPVTFYDYLEIRDSAYLSVSVWSNGKVYTGHDKGLVQCIDDQKKVIVQNRLPLQVVNGIRRMTNSLLVVYGHADYSDEFLIYLLEENTLKVKSRIALASYVHSFFVNQKNELVAGDGEGCIRIYSAEGSLRDSIQLKGIDDNIEELAQDTNGGFMVLLSHTGSFDSVIRYFDRRGVQKGSYITQAGKSLKKMAFFGGTGHLVAVDEQGNSYGWNKTGLPLNRSGLVEDGLLAPGANISLDGVFFTPSGNRYVILVNGRCILRQLDGKIKAVASTLFSSATSISFLTEDRFVTSGVKDPCLFFWDTRGYLIETKLMGQHEKIWWSEQSADYCVQSGDSLTVQDWNARQKGYIVFRNEFSEITYMCSDTGNNLLIAGAGKACLYERHTGKRRQVFPFPKKNKVLYTDFQQHKLYMNADNGRIKVLDWEKNTADSFSLPKIDEISFLKVHKTGMILIGGGTVSKSAFLLLYDKDHRLKTTFEKLSSVVNDGLFSADGTKVTIVDDAGKLKQYNVASGKQLLDVQAGNGIATSVRMTKDEKYYIVNDMIMNAVHLLDANGYHLQQVDFEVEPDLVDFSGNDQFTVQCNNRLYRLFSLKGFMESERIIKGEKIERMEEGIQPFVVSHFIRERI